MKVYRTLRIQLVHSRQCNLSCFYCCKEGSDSHFCILRDENIINCAKACKDLLHISRIKYTGGEPLIYKPSCFCQESTLDKIMVDLSLLGLEQSLVTNGTEIETLKKISDQIKQLDLTISLPTLNYSTFKNICGHNEFIKFQSILNSLDFIISRSRPLKINYVLIKGFNTSKDEIEAVIEKYGHNRNVNIRFLELISNSSNNIAPSYHFNNEEFEALINQLGFNVIDKSKSYVLYENNENIRIKFINFFCNSSCSECPNDKTSLWLTADGYLKNCNFGNKGNVKIEDWTYSGICGAINKLT